MNNDIKPTEMDKPETKKDTPITWIVRLLKGFISGIGAITPGLSGGVMMVVFGIYEPLLKWLADIRKNFLRNLLFYDILPALI